jgi:hypothetical protein
VLFDEFRHDELEGVVGDGLGEFCLDEERPEPVEGVVVDLFEETEGEGFQEVYFEVDGFTREGLSFEIVRYLFD